MDACAFELNPLTLQDPVTQRPAIMVCAADCTVLESLKQQLDDTLSREAE